MCRARWRWSPGSPCSWLQLYPAVGATSRRGMEAGLRWGPPYLRLRPPRCRFPPRDSPSGTVGPAATTTVIDRLERAGLVVRTRDAENRRRVLITATDAAHTIEQDIYLPVGAAGARALRRYDKDQLATILDFLQTARQVQEDQTARVSQHELRAVPGAVIRSSA